MTKKLCDQDQRVIDLLLDQSERPSAVQGYSEPSKTVSGRVSGAENLLGLLDLCVATEPPTDLVRRTLARIDESYSNSPLMDRSQRDNLGPMA